MLKFLSDDVKIGFLASSSNWWLQGVIILCKLSVDLQGSKSRSQGSLHRLLQYVKYGGSCRVRRAHRLGRPSHYIRIYQASISSSS
mmetsp:Transcript_1787/g.206  ORF Transcript_1787/g.206 Transcript_1787/m.206 type:complete len:86 (-) Transcript_1787:918-1175(-)